jgi:hypothetical protein
MVLVMSIIAGSNYALHDIINFQEPATATKSIMTHQMWRKQCQNLNPDSAGATRATDSCATHAAGSCAVLLLPMCIDSGCVRISASMMSWQLLFCASLVHDGWLSVASVLVQCPTHQIQALDEKGCQPFRSTVL